MNANGTPLKLDADAYPLYWPEGWPRTQPGRRELTYRYKVTCASARDELVADLLRLGASELIVSTNIPLRKDGLPRMDVSEPNDPGVAVYWIERGRISDKFEGKSRVIACDRWSKVRDNMRAVGLAVQALRALHRSGATQVIDRVFRGFSQLPADVDAARPRHPWRAILGLGPGIITAEELRDAYRKAALNAHPDRGGNDDALRSVNAAHAAARAELGL